MAVLRNKLTSDKKGFWCKESDVKLEEMTWINNCNWVLFFIVLLTIKIIKTLYEYKNEWTYKMMYNPNIWRFV